LISAFVDAPDTGPAPHLFLTERQSGTVLSPALMRMPHQESRFAAIHETFFNEICHHLTFLPEAHRADVLLARSANVLRA
jgi:hypothetical protein